MTIGSLFSGIGGFDLGFERAGFEVKWQVEIDPFCLAVLAEHWPQVKRYQDVRTLVAPESVDVICGGFPCQPHSLAGRRGGSADERDLWDQFARVIRDVRPRWVVAENVPGLLSSDAGRFFGGVLGDLAACGYDAEWDCLPAAAFGAPHRRDRVWVVAYPNRGRELQPEGREQAERGWTSDGREVMADTDEGRRRASWPSQAQAGTNVLALDGHTSGVSFGSAVPGRESRDYCGDAGSDQKHAPLLADAASGARQRATSREAGHVAFSGEDVADAHGDALRQQPVVFGRCGSAPVAEFDEWWRTEPDVGRVAHGIPARVDRLRGLGNAIVPQIAEWIARQILSAEERVNP